MMKEFANAKENYDSIPIPAELPSGSRRGFSWERPATGAAAAG